MPVVQSGGCPINVQIDGPDNAPVLILSNSLGTTLAMWDPQVPAFSKHFRVVRYDRRGHGKSGVPAPPYSMEMLGRDVLAIMDGLGIAKTNWCGLSMGGMIGQWLGANAADRFDRLVLSNTACYYADKNVWNDRIAAVKKDGTAVVATGTASRWFTPGFIVREPAQVTRLTGMVRATPLDGYIGCCEAVRDMDHRPLLSRITGPTLIIGGRHDPATTVADAEYLRDRIHGSKLTVLEAAHISNVEQADKFTAEVVNFLKPQAS
ncbi:MAG TPA: 3-oxoadipate enol-lactonase [Xanthobacteraceae bacterium]|nr:3-oxoadipate enol-lactonase [Xanthobacteraceae bacterium]